MAGQLEVLVTSAQLESRRALTELLDNLSLNVISSSNLRQAEEVLSQRPIEIVFCDAKLPDGSYRDLLPARRPWKKTPRAVVTSHTDEWNDYLEAIRLGAFDVIRSPMHPTDVELIVIRAMHEEAQRASLRDLNALYEPK